MSASTPVPCPADAHWDAGDLGCGELVLELRRRLETMRPGQLLQLIARDPGARADVPAWCRMTGHVLIADEHPVYRIRRKES
jgi:tRNA 2-thiouridine synthesizing protein A